MFPPKPPYRLCIYCRSLEGTDTACPCLLGGAQTTAASTATSDTPVSGLTAGDAELIRKLQEQPGALCARCSSHNIADAFRNSRLLDPVQRARAPGVRGVVGIEGPNAGPDPPRAPAASAAGAVVPVLPRPVLRAAATPRARALRRQKITGRDLRKETVFLLALERINDQVRRQAVLTVTIFLSQDFNQIGRRRTSVRLLI